MFVYGSGQISNLYRVPSIYVLVHLAKRLHRRFLEIDQSETSFGSFSKAVSEEKIFRNLPIRKQVLPVVTMFVNGSVRNEQFLHRTAHRWYLSSFGSFGLVQRRRYFRNQPIRNKNCLWRPCLLTDRDEMSNFYRRPPIDDTYQVSVHLAHIAFGKVC